MKLSEIKTNIFQRVCERTYGFSFEIFDNEGYKHPQNKWPMFLMSVNVTTDGNIFVVTKRPTNNKITLEQLNEITRVANLLKENKNE